MSKCYFVKRMSDGNYWWFEFDPNSADWKAPKRRDVLDWIGVFVGWLLNLGG